MINVLEMLERSAIRYPGDIAFSDPFGQITYSQLNIRSKWVGTLFNSGSKTAKVNIGDGVAFFMEKSVEALVAMFGTVYAGGFYSFIDVRQPVDRVRSILNTLEPAIIITDSANHANLPEEYAVDGKRVILISELMNLARNTLTDDIELDNVRAAFTDNMPLYVNFTSGSTGTPKGVVVAHRSVIDFIGIFTRTFAITHDDILANQAPFDFDVSVKDIYSGLKMGAHVALVPREYFSNPTTLMDYLCNKKVTTLVWAVSAMCFVSIMNGFAYKTPNTITKVMFSGEVMPIKQLNKWKAALPEAIFVNLYGPTEITCNCTYHILDREYGKEDVIPIGMPFPNEKVFLLDENDKEVTVTDTEGEICVSGTCLALGYFKDKEKTDLSFVQNPLNNRFTEIIYRTGDLGKYDNEGNLVYTSRKDFQIKHMGQRIELGDIENTAMTIDGVERVCCIYDHKHSKILLFVCGQIDKDEVSNALHDKLPPFMMPNKTIVLNTFPLNKNGKIDRNALMEHA